MKAIMAGAFIALALAGCVADETPPPTAVTPTPTKTAKACPEVAPGNAERAVRCIGGAGRKLYAERWPEISGRYDKILEGEVIAARKYDTGKISGQRYNDESNAYRDELAAIVIAKLRQDQCRRIVEAMARISVDPSVSNPNVLEAVLVERKAKNERIAKNLGCL